MKITKIPPKRLATAPPWVVALSDQLVSCPQDDLPTLIHSLPEWSHPKGDMFHWIPVLNRFDLVLEAITKPIDSTPASSASILDSELAPESVPIITSILHFTKLLWENCTNRNLYNSYEHLIKLLGTRNIVVLESVLALLIRSAQRISSQRSLKTILTSAHEAVVLLAQRWPSLRAGTAFADIASPDFVPSADLFSLSFQYYQLADPKPTLAVASADARPSATQPDAVSAVGPAAPPTSSAGIAADAGPAVAASAAALFEHRPIIAAPPALKDAPVSIFVPDLRLAGASDTEILASLVSQHKIPLEHQFPLFHRIRTIWGLQSAATRVKMLELRLLALAIFANLTNEEAIQTKILLYEPDLITQLAALLKSDSFVGKPLQCAAMHALDGLARHRAKMNEVLAALNASANHGILMSLVKKITTGHTDDQSPSRELADAVLSLVTHVSTTQTGGNLMISGGLIQALTDVLSITDPGRVKYISRCITLLDNLIYGFTSAFSAFSGNNGLALLVQRLKDEVEHYWILSENSMQPYEIPHEGAVLIRALFKFVLHMMQTAGTADNMRSLIDSSLPSSILKVYKKSNMYGAGIFGLAVNIMATFIHNEPTSLAILQESKLPEEFLAALSGPFPVSAEVFSALPNAFGAICLNQVGLDGFMAAKPVPKFLSLFTAEENLKSLQDNDVPNLVGNALDELVRHHPSLKSDVITAIVQTLQAIVDMGKVVQPDEVAMVFLNTASNTVAADISTLSHDGSSAARNEPRILQFFDIYTRVMEGFFQNPAHSKDFIKLGGMEPLLAITALPGVPHDFPSSPSSYSMSFLLRALIEADHQVVIGHITAELKRLLAEAEELMNARGDSVVMQYIDIEDAAKLQSGNRLFRALAAINGYTRLLSDIWFSHSLSVTRGIIMILQAFGEKDDTLLSSLGQLQRACGFENMCLKSSVPDAWYNPKKNPAQKTVSTALSSLGRSTASSSFDALDTVLASGMGDRIVPIDSDIATGGTSTPMATDPSPLDKHKLVNVKAWKYLLTEIQSVLGVTFQSVVKALSARRNIDAAQRLAAHQLVEAIAKILIDHLRWERPAHGGGAMRNEYLTNGVVFIIALVSDDRNKSTVLKSITVAFVLHGGIETLLSLAEGAWSDTEALSQPEGEPKNHTITLLESIVSVFAFLCSAKHHSHSTTHLVLAPGDGDKMFHRYLHFHNELLIDIRLLIAPLIVKIWREQQGRTVPRSIMSGVLEIVQEILKGQGEERRSSRLPGFPHEFFENSLSLPTFLSSFPGFPASANRRATQPRAQAANEERVQQLMDMGFPRGASANALIRFHNNIGRAADYLLSHPEVLFDDPTPTTSTAPVPPFGIPTLLGENAPEGAADSSDNPLFPEVESAVAGEPIASSSSSTAPAPVDTEMAGTSAPTMALPEASSSSSSSSIPTESKPALETPQTDRSTSLSHDPDSVTLTKRANEQLVKLNSIRSELENDFIDVAIPLLCQSEAAIFDIRDIILHIIKTKNKELLNFLVKAAGDDFAEIAKGVLEEATTKRLHVALRLLVLFTGEGSIREDVLQATRPLIGDIVKRIVERPVDETEPVWLSPALLLVELHLIAHSNAGHSGAPSGSGGADHILEGHEGQTKLMASILEMSKAKHYGKHLQNALMVVLVFLTKDQRIASEFVHLGGIAELFNSSRFGGFANQLAMSMMIIRHAVETQETLKTTMEDEITRTLSKARHPGMDEINQFLRTCSGAVLRSKDAFLDAIVGTCELKRFNPHSARTIRQPIGLKNIGPKKPAGGDSGTSPDTKDPAALPTEVAEAGQAMAIVDARDEVPSKADRATSSTAAEAVVQFIISELLKMKAEGKAHYDKPSSELNEDDERFHIKRCFLLQALAELAVSYEACKYEILEGSSSRRLKTPQKSRIPIVNHVVQDILPHGCLSLEGKLSKLDKVRIDESRWAASLLTALSIDFSDTKSSPDDAKEPKRDILTTTSKKAALEAVARAMKESLSSADTLQQQYSKFFVYSELCCKILSTKVRTVVNGEDPINAVGKTMLEKNYVTLLTSMLGEVDAGHPNATTVIAAILKPLELLSNLAIKIGKVVPASTPPKPKSTQPLSPTAAARAATAMEIADDSRADDSDDDGDEDEDEDEDDRIQNEEIDDPELSNAYRTSALGMFNAAGDANDQNESTDYDDDEDDEGYVEYVDYTTTEGEDMSESEDSLASDADDDMEIVVPNTYQGGVDLPPEEEEEIGADDDEIDEDHDHDDDEEEEEGEEDGAVEGAAPTIDFDDGDAMWVDAEDDMNVDRRTEDQSEGDDGDHDLGVGADGVRQRNDSDGLFDLTNDDIEEEEEDEEDESEEEDEDDGAYEFIEEFGEQPDDGDEGTHHEIPLHSATFRSIQRNLMALDNHMHHHLHSEPIARVAMPNEISLLHPLLINPSRNQPGDLRIGMPPRRSRETIRRRVPGLLNGLGSFHPDNVAEVMEEILSRAQRMGSNGEVFVEVPDTFLTGTAHQELRGRLIGAERAVLAIPEPPPISDVLASAQSLLVTGSMERWAQEAMLLYGTTALETAMKVSDALLDRLVPLAEQEVERKRLIQEKLNEEKAREEAQRRAEEEKRRNEEEQRLTEEKRRAEEQEAEKREAERLAAEQEGAIAGPSQITPDAAPSNSATEVAAAAVPTQPATEEQVIVTVFGNEYNITGTGIDPTFLAALPEDLQEEIIREHLREQRLSRPPVQPSSDIGPEFLSVLPEELRFEVLAQERASGSSAAGEATTGQGSGLHGFPPSFPTPFGQPPFMESSVPYISELTNSLLRGSTDASDRVRHLFQPAHISITGGFRPAKKASSGSKATRREPIQLVEKPGLMNLLRLLFVPEPPKKQVILKILVNFCENSKSRTDLMVLLLTMLAEGSVEVSTVDKGLSQLSIKAKMKQTTPKKGGGAPSAAAQPSPLPPSASISLGSLESIPHLLAQRSLEALIHLVELNQRMAQFFVVEDESFSQLNSKPSKPVTPKRAKGKEKPQPTSPSYPLISVLLLLEKPLFRSNPRLMEQLMHLLAIILKSLAILKEKADQGAQGSTGGPSTAPAASGTVAVAGPSTATGTNVEAPVASSSSTAPVESVGQPSTAAQRDDAILASIPESYLRSVIDVLTAGECTSRTFQNIISVIRHLSRADRNLELFTKKLRESAQQLADHMLQDLERLQSALATTSTAGVPDETIVDTFSSPTSHQSKLLRIFKTIDFVYSKTPSKPTGEKGASEPPVSFDGQALMGIYDGLVLAQLWTKLGVCLAAINDSPELISIATILLPTIESFMVVSKPYVLTLEHRSASGTGSSAKTHANEDHFVKFTETHRKLLNIMVRNNPSLMSGSFALLVQNPKMLEFDNKRTYFNQQLHKKTNRIHSGSLPITVRRQYVFEDSYNHLRDKSGDDVKYGKLNVRFKDEEGVDAGGVTREWFSVLARQMFNPDYALFKSSAVDRVTYQPNRSSGVNPEHLSYFKFVGRIIGKAIYDGRLLDCYFTRSFYKCMLGIPVDYKDMEAIDPELYKSFEWILSNDITDVLDLTFSYETDEFGIHKVVDLKENGHSIPVTDTNKHEYVTLTAQQRLVVAIQQQINAFLAGFHEIIPRDLVKIMNEQELELLISGLPDIDIDDWKNNTEYQNYTPASPQIQWFWRAVRSFTQEERAKLIQFATGTSKIPLEGFAHIQGSNGIQKFQIHKDFSSTLRLPSAHTCFNQIDLPQYESYEQLRSSLLTAISECGTGFGLA